MPQLVLQATDIHGGFLLHGVVLPKKCFDCGNLIVRDDGCLQAGPQSQLRNPPGIVLVVVNIADVYVLVGVSHDGIEDENLQARILEPVIQRKMINTGGFHVDFCRQIVCLLQG